MDFDYFYNREAERFNFLKAAFQRPLPLGTAAIILCGHSTIHIILKNYEKS